MSASDSRAQDKTQLTTWTVVPGGRFWRIAAETLAESMAVDPRKRQVAAYWLALIEAKPGRLVVANNPDLLYPSQVLVLPPPTGTQDQPGEQTSPRSDRRPAALSKPTPSMHAIAPRSSRLTVRTLPLKSWRWTWIIVR
jgi:hypothetical protein